MDTLVSSADCAASWSPGEQEQARPVLLHILRKIAFRASLLASLVMLQSCATPPLDVFDTPIEDGRTLREMLVGRIGPTAVLVYTPEACLVCSSALPLWIARSREVDLNLVLLVAGDVSEEDRRILRIHRIPVAAIVSSGSLRLDRLPAEYLFVGGRIVARAEGYEAIRRERLWLSPLL